MSYHSAIIHISDIECGEDNRAEPKYAPTSLANPYTKCARDLVKDIEALVLTKHAVDRQLIGLVITGDIAYKDQARDFVKARELLGVIRAELELPPERIALVPGNHDCSWSDCLTAYQGDPHNGHENDPTGLRQRAASLPQKLARFAELFQDFCGFPFPFQGPIPFEGFANLGLALVGLDTTYAITFTPEDNHGLLSVDHVEKTKTVLNRMLAQNKNLVPAALMHHCLDPRRNQNEKDMSYLWETETAEQALTDAGFGIVFAGHEHHTRQSSDLSGGFQKLVTGSFGLGPDALFERYGKPNYPESNKYQILLANPDGTSRIEYRRLNLRSGVATGRWEADTDRRTDNRPGSFELFRLAAPQLGTGEGTGDGWATIIAGSARKWEREGESVLGVRIGGTLQLVSEIQAVQYWFEGSEERVEGDPDAGFLAHLRTRLSGDLTVFGQAIRRNGEVVRLRPSKVLIRA